MKKILFFLIFVISLQDCFSQIEGLTRSADGKSIFIPTHGRNMAWFDASGNTISKEQFNDSLKTGDYIMSVLPDTLVNKFYLENKYPNKSKLIGTKVPSLTYPDIYGDTVKIGNTSNFSVLLFWSISCGPCIQELIVFNILAKEFPNFNFYAITTENKTVVADFLNQKNYKWDNIVIVTDYNLADYNPEIHYYPACIFMNKDRIIQNVCFKENLRQKIALMENLDKK